MAYGDVVFVSLPGGILDDHILNNVSAIAQQCNCTGCYGKGLSSAISSKLPFGCSYKNRRKNHHNLAVEDDWSTPGSIDIHEKEDNPLVINMFAQINPGKYTCDLYVDNKRNRIKWFKQCLCEISKLKLETIAFPEYIGCNLAGGDWNTYCHMLSQFAKENAGTKVTIVKRHNH